MKVKLADGDMLEVEVEQEGQKILATLRGGFHSNYCTVTVHFDHIDDRHYTLSSSPSGETTLAIFSTYDATGQGIF